MDDAIRPTDEQELAAALADAGAAGRRLQIRGGGTKAAFGGAACDHAVLDLRAFSGVVDYDPAELVLTARAGTPLRELEGLVAAQGQMLAFEPPDLSAVFGADWSAATLGGTVAANLSGPRRLSHGAVRDHVLGFHAVTGGGEVFKAGARVVKNVTGFDLSKLMTGSWGSLAALTVVTLKVLPAPRASQTLVWRGLDDAAGLAVCRAAMRLPAEVSGAAHVPGAFTALRIEGVEASVRERAALLCQSLADRGAPESVTGEDSEALWRGVAGLSIHANRTTPLWRLSLPASAAPRVAEAADTQGLRCSFDWAGAAAYVEGRVDPGFMHSLAAALDGHARLIRAGDGPTPPAPPPSPAVGALNRRIKAAFDPKHVLWDRWSLGRMD